jgi:homoserine O-acetyltransferase
MALADALGIRRIRFVIGGSMGGLQALEWALLDPQRVGAVVTIAAAGRHSAWCVVWSEAQRLALASDPEVQERSLSSRRPAAGGPGRGTGGGDDHLPQSAFTGRTLRAGGREGDLRRERARAPDDFAIRGWLRHHAEALVERFDANSYRLLLDAMDTHDLARNRGVYENVVRQIQQPVLVVSLSSDALYVPRPAQSPFPAAQFPHSSKSSPRMVMTVS